MRGNSALRKYLNFEAVEKALNRVHDEPPYSPNLIILQRTFYLAKFVEWVRRDN